MNTSTLFMQEQIGSDAIALAGMRFGRVLSENIALCGTYLIVS